MIFSFTYSTVSIRWNLIRDCKIEAKQYAKTWLWEGEKLVKSTLISINPVTIIKCFNKAIINIQDAINNIKIVIDVLTQFRYQIFIIYYFNCYTYAKFNNR